MDEELPPLTYRARIVSAVMKCIGAGESCSLVGVSGIGKSALLRFIKRSDVKEQYLGRTYHRYLFINIDCNLLAELSEWGMYEFLLNQITQTIERQLNEITEIDLVQKLRALYWEIEGNKSKLLAQRHLSRSVGFLLKSSFDKVVFFFDEFDGVLKQIDFQLFNNLRGLRDEYRPQISYITLTRQFFPMVREDFENQAEGFYETFSRNVFGLTPYDSDDARQVVSELMTSLKIALHEQEIIYLISTTGGHAGLLKAAFVFLSRGPVANSRDALGKMLQDANIMDECRKIWLSLMPPEQKVLLQIAKLQRVAESESAIAEHLRMKGITVEKDKSGPRIFSPLLAYFLNQLPSP